MDSVENQASEGDLKGLEPAESAPGSPALRDPWSVPPPMALPAFLRSNGVRPDGPSETKVYGMTRRFSMRATMLLMALAAVCTAVLRWVGMPSDSGMVVLFLMIVAAAAQMFMFGGKDPRKASVIAGVIVLPLAIFLDAISQNSRDRGLVPLPLNLVMGAIFGAVVGYIVGALVAGVFLLIDRYDEWRPKKSAAGREH